MQIMPSDSSLNLSYAPWATGSYNADSQFLDVMMQTLEEEEEKPRVESPYSRHSTDGVLYTLDEVCFSKQELQDLRERLLKAGAPRHSLEQFDQLVDMPDGATLAQVMASLLGGTGSARMDAEDIDKITGLLKKIDPSEALGDTVFALLDEGRGQEALDAIHAALAGLEAGSRIDVSRDEILALGRALGLNSSALRGISSNFGNSASMEIFSGQFASLMAQGSEYLASLRADREKLNAALDETLRPLIQKARERMEAAAEASALQNRKVEQSKIMIDQTVLRNSRATLDETLAATEQDMLTRMQLELDGPDADQPLDLFQQQTRENPGRKASEWSELLGKVEKRVEGRPAPVQTAGSSSVFYSVLQGGQSIAENASFDPRAHTPISRHVAQQVEQGMLSSLRGGGSRLDLQLHPMELGAITITLTARNGEVSARLIADKSETADMLTHQMESIRINLEQQGIKVDKIEVQLQNQSAEDHQAWQNLEQHNAWQEHEARREEFARLRQLSTLRTIRTNSNISVLEQSMHEIPHTARYATQSLHVVA